MEILLKVNHLVQFQCQYPCSVFFMKEPFKVSVIKLHPLIFAKK